MPDARQLDALAEEIAADILARAPWRDLSARIPDLEAAYAVQAGVVERLSRTRGALAGRKIGWNTAEQMAAMSMPEPAAGRILRGQVHASPAALRAGDYAALAIEPEFAAILGAPMAPRAGGHDRASAAAAVALIRPALELLDRRGRPAGGAFSMIAANVFNAGIVLGGPGVAPGALDPQAVRSRLEVNGEAALDRTGAAPMHPLDSVAFLANRFNRLGETLAEGEILMLGTHLPPLDVSAPASVRFEIEGLGTAEFEIR